MPCSLEALGSYVTFSRRALQLLDIHVRFHEVLPSPPCTTVFNILFDENCAVAPGMEYSLLEAMDYHTSRKGAQNPQEGEDARPEAFVISRVDSRIPSPSSNGRTNAFSRGNVYYDGYYAMHRSTNPFEAIVVTRYLSMDVPPSVSGAILANLPHNAMENELALSMRNLRNFVVQSQRIRCNRYPTPPLNINGE